MLINRDDIDLLKRLATATNLVSVDSIPMSLKEEFQTYFFGKTLVQEDGGVFAYPHDVKGWVRFVFNKYNE